MTDIKIRPFRAEKIKKPRDWVMPDFSGNAALDLEIGCGVGWHPIRYAEAHPERRLVAIEHTLSRFSAFKRRLENHPGLKNLTAVHADAVAWVTHALSPDSVEQVFFMYPNPYPKKSDLNKRWHAMPFMGKVLEILRPQGEIILATNERFYFEEACEYFVRSWGLELLEARSFDQSSVPGGSPRTHFEKKYLARGQECFQLRVRKVGSSSRQ